MDDNDYVPHFEEIKIVKKLYTTQLSTIWLVKDLKNEFFILKGKKWQGISDHDFNQLKRERAFLEGNKNLSLSRFIKSYKDQQYLYMLLTFFEGVELSELIRDNILQFNKYDESFETKKNLFIKIIQQITSHLNYLQKSRTFYRDLKLNNIIINEDFDVSLIDFGFVKTVEEEEGRTSSVCGTYHCMAPEILRLKLGYENTPYTIKCDNYSLGILMFELFTGKPPFPYVYNFDKENLANYYEIIIKGVDFESELLLVNDNGEKLNEVEKEFIKKLSELITSLTQIDPEKRLNLDEVLTHELFGKNNIISINKESIYIKSLQTEIRERGVFIQDQKTENDVFQQFF
jgi:cGMP-dependent protein kinase